MTEDGMVGLHHWLHGPEFMKTPGVHPYPCPLCRWCHPTVSSSVVPFSSCPSSFPASGSFQMSQLFTSDGQSIGLSASTSVLPIIWAQSPDSRFRAGKRKKSSHLQWLQVCLSGATCSVQLFELLLFVKKEVIDHPRFPNQIWWSNP